MTALSPAAQAVFDAWAPHSDPYYHRAEVAGLIAGLRAAADYIDDDAREMTLRNIAANLEAAWPPL